MKNKGKKNLPQQYALIFKQILSCDQFIKNCMEASVENFHVDLEA